MSKSSNLYRRRYFQTQIIRYCVDSSWLIYQNLWAITVHGVIAFYKPTWCRYKQVRLQFANQLQPRSQPGDESNSDEVFLQLNGRIDDRWQTVNQDNNLLSVLESLKCSGAESKRPNDCQVLVPATSQKTVQRSACYYDPQLKSHTVVEKATLASVGHYYLKQLNRRAKNFPQLIQV